ncbi:hypothetical protein GS493_05800 [Rhodococcus hoagii]|nr:hypothetical protein [Prescottella equi]
MLADADLSLTAHRWLPGDPIPYDAMRAILGLPDVRDEVMRMRAKLFLDSASGQPYVFYSDESPPESTEWRTIRFESGLEVRVGGRASGRQGVRLDEHIIPARYADRYSAELAAINASTFPAPRTPQERALPRPSHTPPMWANDPTRTRRRRNR